MQSRMCADDIEDVRAFEKELSEFLDKIKEDYSIEVMATTLTIAGLGGLAALCDSEDEYLKAALMALKRVRELYKNQENNENTNPSI